MNYRTQNGRTSKRGTFLNGIWHCDCEPRMPADKFQTKNGGKNHGRWFYTCQKPQPKRCGFFLWQDDAKVREESAVLSNSRSEPAPVPQTPKKPISYANAPITPASRGTARTQEKTINLTATPIAKSDTSNLALEDSFEWPSSDEAELVEAAAQTTMAPPFETPRKTPRTYQLTSPGKRSRSEMQGSDASDWPISTPSNDDDVFATPKSSNRSNGLLSPTLTPAKVFSQLGSQYQSSKDETSNSTLATEAIDILALVPLNQTVKSQLVALLNKYDLRTQGIAKGREIARLAIQSKDKKIAELQERIAGLEAEHETSRTVIAYLKQDIGINASSPRKERRRFSSRNGSPGKT